MRGRSCPGLLFCRAGALKEIHFKAPFILSEEGLSLSEDTVFMEEAIALAKLGAGWVSPNPLVGAVVVKEGEVIGRGYHRRAGDPHAERSALADCSQSPEGATLYVTLEPCCHQGRTPPCTDCILERGVRRVVVGSADPNPLVAGRGVQLLRERGVEVTEGVLREACDRLNPVFFHYIRTGTPYVVMKYAMTMDGKIAARTGLSRWITGEEARRRVQEDRGRYRAIMAGIGTVLQDDPLLTCRLPGCRSPLRVICDTRLRTPLNARVVRTAGEFPTLLATCCGERERLRPYEEAGCQALVLPPRGRGVDLTALMAELGSREVDSVLLEGGGALNWSALESGIVNRVQAYLAPKILGGAEAKGPVGGLGADSPAGAFRLAPPTVTRLGEDILLESEVISCLQES